MSTPYTSIDGLEKQIEIKEKSTISRTIFSDDTVKVLLFGFDAGQELLEHTASMPATIHILKGEARLTLGTDK
ncbi:MAG: cupin, partial [Chlorobiales bacterium]|nr:cupin [Chlorobiales bacterium]